LDCDVFVVRNDEIQRETLDQYHKIILSPGSGLPEQAGDMNAMIEKYAPTKSILGICLGQQAIAEIFGGKLIALDNVKHGESCIITHCNNDALYKDISKDLQVGLYFSWQTTSLPDSLIPTALDKNGIVMSLKHKEYDLRAVQYHPESIMTPMGKKLLQNWLEI
jgi:anthranilate synthase component 2